MKKYTRPTVEIVELSVKESLSDLPAKFGGIAGDKTGFSFRMGTLSSKRNVSIYTFDSGAKTNA